MKLLCKFIIRSICVYDYNKCRKGELPAHTEINQINDCFFYNRVRRQAHRTYCRSKFHSSGPPAFVIGLIHYCFTNMYYLLLPACIDFPAQQQWVSWVTHWHWHYWKQTSVIVGVSFVSRLDLSLDCLFVR